MLAWAYDIVCMLVLCLRLLLVLLQLVSSTALHLQSW